MAKGLAPVPSPTVFASIKRVKRTILDELKGLDDPRNKREPNHLLSDIVTIAILATLCGADNMVAVETYGREKQDWLATFLELPYGIPSHDTFSRVFATIDPEQFHGFFLRWVQQLTVQLNIKIINLDGKTARGSYDREESLKALHSVTAWAAEHHLVLDVTFKEDHSRIRRGHGPENMNLLRRLCVNLIKQDKAKGSINLKRYRAAMNNDYALTLLGVHNSES